MASSYSENIFSKIIKGEIPCKKIFEDENVLSFWDIYPKAPIHALVIPKLNYSTFEQFAQNEPSDVVGNFFIKVNFIATDILNLKYNFKLVINNGEKAGQEVPHFHVHILSN
jgi:histidine triad (HIT) family protein